MGAGSLTRAAKAARELRHRARRESPSRGRAARAQHLLRCRLPIRQCGEPVRRVPGRTEPNRGEQPGERVSKCEFGTNAREGKRLTENAALHVRTQTADAGSHALICMSFA